MDTDKDRTVRRFVRWLKDKIENKRNRDGDHDPWWVTLLLDLGRPVVAVLILTMCAPGEHYLAVQAGWSERLAWGMPGALTAYAGIAAVVATKRPAGAPGRKTAIWGAVLSILVAMAAQPLAHLYGRVWVPTAAERVWLTITVSCIPAAVFGHLLHMGAATPKVRRTAVKTDKPKRTARADKVLAGADSGLVPVSTFRAPVQNTRVDMTTWTGHEVVDNENHVPVRPPDSELSKILDSIPDTDRPVRRTADGSMRTVAYQMIMDNPDVSDDELRTAILDRFGQDSKANSVWKSIKRARTDSERAS